MHTRWLSAFRTQPRGTRVERVIFACSAVIFTLDIASEIDYFSHSGSLAFNLAMSAAGVVTLALTGFFPATGGVMFILVLTVAAGFNGEVGLLGAGTYIIAADWMFRGWYLPAVLGAVVVEGTNMATTDNTGFVSAFVFGMAVAAPVGLGLRWQTRQTQVLEEQLGAVQEVARQEAIDRLKAELHGTVARNLSQLTLAAQNLPLQTDIAKKSAHMERLSRESLDAIRTLIKGLEPLPEMESIAEAVRECQVMLQEKHITLDVITDTDSEALTDIPQLKVACLGIQEGALNILKYGHPDTTSTLTFEKGGDGSVTMTLANEIDVANRRNDCVAGGYGLGNLSSRAQAIGGDAYGWRLDNLWILTMVFPSPMQAGKEKILDTQD